MRVHEASCNARDTSQHLTEPQHRLPPQSVQQEDGGEVGGYLHQDGEGVVEVEVRSEGGGGGGETVVAHGGHHPVEEHGAGPDEDGGGPEQVEDSGRLDHRHVAHTVVILLLGL